MGAAKHAVTSWDTDVAWRTLGYNCSPQRSTGFTPYELLYACPPFVAPATSEAFTRSIDVDNADVAVKDLLLRREKIAQMTPMALQNLAIAQHRDQLRCLRVCAADYEPERHHFMVGQYVYVQQLQRYNTLQLRAQPVMYRVLEIKDSEVLKLQGKCGSTDVHMSHCAPCHLLDTDGTVHPRLVEDIEAIMCEVCGRDEHENVLLICDICISGYHTYCLQPTLDAVPAEQYWLCPVCVKEGYTAEDAEVRALQREQLQEHQSRPNMYPNAGLKQRDANARELHGRLVRRPFKDPVTGRKKCFWGRLNFRGQEHRPYYFQVIFEDGDTHIVSTTTAKKWLVNEGVQPPAGVTVTAKLVAHGTGPPQQYFLDCQDSDKRFACMNVPDEDLAALTCYIQLSMAQQLADPVTCNQQWKRLAGGRSLTFTVQLLHGAVALLMSPARPAVLPAFHYAMSLKPAIILCYAPSVVLEPAVHQLVAALKLLGLAVAYRVTFGWWIVVSRPPVKVANLLC